MSKNFTIAELTENLSLMTGKSQKSGNLWGQGVGERKGNGKANDKKIMPTDKIENKDRSKRCEVTDD